MNREERFHRSVSVLAKAYREGTLASEDCMVCAIGNLCADALNLKVILNGYGGYQWVNQDGSDYDDAGAWLSPLNTYRCDWTAVYMRLGTGMAQIKATGYTMQEVDAIEHAFERACGKVRGDMDEDGEYIEDFDYENKVEVTGDIVQYAGLAAVYEVLCKIHEIPVLDQVEPNTLFFKEEKPEYAEMMVEVNQR
jgi:hypothetical protein